MAEIVLGIGSSHSPMLNSPAGDYGKHGEIDQSGRKLLDEVGQPTTYEALATRRGDSLAGDLLPEEQARKAAACESHIQRLAEEVASARLDAVIVIGDDQNEQYGDDNLPAILVYWGKTIVNRPLAMPAEAPAFWRLARSQYHEDEGPREYPVAHELGRHVIDSLMDESFDISQSRQLAKPHGEGHAFGFVHRRLMTAQPVPILPIALNTYYPPNQPRPARCYALGQALARAVASWENDARVGIVASGGLSHFTVDEELDRLILRACAERDAEALKAIDPRRLNSGSSEIRNWITVAGAVEHLRLDWQAYEACYRTPAGTGCGMAFATWKPERRA
ncbi:Gallate dioxygenase [Pigmentiphaga humi]|uniref:Gallate dioxygenase n=1 Tax=Pigmentiphaga humi TaxID=2478468 RepID=A0A3P4AXI6_9BURK|nr:extradiol ring-cleavage dioxygenase [Pigmentiphaga humi]VCU68773.1 Gallate dioxygenase [Pigmentiphaga humi]